MTNLLLSVLSSTFIVVLFRLFVRFKIKNQQAIIANYFMAGSLGFMLDGSVPDVDAISKATWLEYSLIIGVLFITLFNIMALSAQKVGVAITSVANKMSFIIPVIAAYFLFHDPLSLIKILGIVLALVGVYLASTQNGRITFNKRDIWLPVTLFFGGGLLDTLLNYTDKQFHTGSDPQLYTSMLFLWAGVLGMFWYLIVLSRGKAGFSLRSWLAGFLLGIPNYASIFFLLRAIADPEVPSTTIFPLNNIGIVLLSALSGLLLFHEKLDRDNWIGIVLSSASIALIGLLG